MGSINYDKVGKIRCRSSSGIRIRRFSVKRLRAKLMYVLKLFNRLKTCYRKVSRLLRKQNQSENDQIRAPMYVYRLSQTRRPLEHSNSFCAAAIADCVDFIKRNSVSVDDDKRPMLTS